MGDIGSYALYDNLHEEVRGPLFQQTLYGPSLLLLHDQLPLSPALA